MTPATIIREARAEGVRLALSAAGTIKATGDGTAVNRWLSVIREHKAEIIGALKASPSDTTTASRWRITKDGRSAIVSCPGNAEDVRAMYPSAGVTPTDEPAPADLAGMLRDAPFLRGVFVPPAPSAGGHRHWTLIHRDGRREEIFVAPLRDAAQMRRDFPDAVAERAATTIRRPSAAMSTAQEAAIRAWLDSIGEIDPETIAEVIGQCQRDADARDYFIGRAAADDSP